MATFEQELRRQTAALGFILLKGIYWLTVHFVEAIEKLREKLKLEGLDSPRWIDRFGELLIKGLD